MDLIASQDGRHAELYVRSLLPETARSHQQSARERLAALSEAGTLADWSVTVWGRQVPAAPAATDTEFGRVLHGHLRAFTEWARVNDRSLAPAFEVRSVEATIPDERYHAIVLPRTLLVEYGPDGVDCVTPHAGADRVVSVTDRLCALDDETATEFCPVEPTPIDTEAAGLEVQGGTIGHQESVVSE